jgi:hypothetical protein
MKKSAAAVTAAVAVLALGLLSGVALAGDHHGDHGSQQAPKGQQHDQNGKDQTTSDQQPGQKPGPHTQKDTTCTTGGGSGSSATCSQQGSSKSDSSKRYGNGKTAAQIANGKGAPSGTPVYGPGNSQPHKICGRDVHAYKGGDCQKQEKKPKPNPKPEEQTVTFCDMDSATTGKLETKSVDQMLNHELNGTPEEVRDIIPPFTVNGKTYSQGWDSNGQAIFNAGCNLPQTPPPTTTAPAPQSVTFCDMDSPTSGKLETKSVDEVIHHELNGTPEEVRDIVPPFTVNGTTYSQLWNSTTEAIFNNDCVAPAAVLATTTATVATTTTQSTTTTASTTTTTAAAAAASLGSSTPIPPSSSPPSAPSGVLGATHALHAPAAHAPAGVLGTIKTLGTSATSGTLPFTGLRLWIFELVALGLIGAGVATRLLARRSN